LVIYVTEELVNHIQGSLDQQVTTLISVLDYHFIQLSYTGQKVLGSSNKAKGQHGFCTPISNKQNSKAPENTDTLSFGNQNRSGNQILKQFFNPYCSAVQLCEEIKTTIEMFNVNFNKLQGITTAKALGTVRKVTDLWYRHRTTPTLQHTSIISLFKRMKKDM
jgi:hypothetical protein